MTLPPDLKLKFFWSMILQVINKINLIIMSRFVSEQTQKIELDGGDWIEIKDKVSWQSMQTLFSLNKEGDVTAMALPLLKEALKGWNFTSESGEEVECLPENIEKLDFQTVQDLITKIMDHYTPKKKK